MRNQINFNYLECFFSLAKTLNFSKTGQDLQIAQPAISKQIKLFEQQLGNQLFLRTRQKVELTRFGRDFYNKTWPLYHQMDSRINEALNIKDQMEGKITFACLREVGEKIFTPLLIKFKKKFPKSQIEIQFLKSFEIVTGIKNGTLDIGITSEKIIQENIRIYQILEEKIILVTNNKNKTKKIKNISDLPFAAYRKNDPLLAFYMKKVFPNTKLTKLNFEFVVNSHKAMIESIVANDLYAILPSLSIQNELKNKKIIDIGPETLKSSLYLIHFEKEYMDKKIITLREYLMKALNEK